MVMPLGGAMTPLPPGSAHAAVRRTARPVGRPTPKSAFPGRRRPAGPTERNQQYLYCHPATAENTAKTQPGRSSESTATGGRGCRPEQ